jgi:ABC-type bacteriocin/lantibiotic exporter with double-glycine peptidase domain
MKEQLRLQERDGWCGPAALQLITREHGLTYSQSELATLMGTTEEFGTSHYQMFCGAIKLGLQPTQVLGQPIETIAKALPDFHVIVNWMTGTNETDDGHYDYLRKIEDGKVYLTADTMTIEEFNSKWYDIEDGKRIERWAMIVKKSIV